MKSGKKWEGGKEKLRKKREQEWGKTSIKCIFMLHIK